MTHANPPRLPIDSSLPEDEFRRRVSQQLNKAFDGYSDAHGSVTLTASAASTVVTDPRAGFECVVLFMPLTANASAEIGAGTMYVSAQTNGAFTVTHANNAQTDRNFRYSIVN